MEIFARASAPPVAMTPVANLPSVSTSLVENLPPVSMTPTVNFATGTAGVVNTGVNNTGGKLPLESTTPATVVVEQIIVTIAECFQLYYPKVSKQNN